MTYDLDGRHVLVTGASSGIGEALARELARAGARLTLVARRRDKLEALAAELGSATALPWDLAAARGGRLLGEALVAEHPPVDVLVNNAGTSGEISLLVDKSAASVRDTFELNLLAPVELLHALLPGLMARRSGVIVNVSSVSAWAPTPRSATYVASKRALTAVDEVLRLELVGSGVHVLSVFPGPVETPMLAKTLSDPFGASLGRLPTGTADELARRVRRAIERGQEHLVYPAAFAPVRLLSPLVGAIMQRVGPLLGVK